MTDIDERQLDEQVALLTRGCEALYTEPELRSRLAQAAKTGRPLRIKLGMDPTAPDIHVGHSVVLRKMRQFQDLGHKAVLIIGDYTARVGDPTGVNKTRPMLSPEMIEDNARTYFEQAGKILDTSEDKLEIRSNSEWLEKLTFADVLQLAARKTVAQMLQRDSFKKRLAADQDVFLHEFLYPIMQGYDSVVIEADVELGGTDQTFNNLVGRDLQKSHGQPPQIVLIMPILVGLDGVEKMSKSKGNYIGITDEPAEMFGKVMSIPDALMDNYYTLLTARPRAEIDVLLDADQTHPRTAKAELGKLVVAQYHGPDAAEPAAAAFDRVFREHQLPDDMPEITLPVARIDIVAMIVAAGFAKSNSEARRFVTQNAVSINDQKITNIDDDFIPVGGRALLLRVGKRRFAKIADFWLNRTGTAKDPHR